MTLIKTFCEVELSFVLDEQPLELPFVVVDFQFVIAIIRLILQFLTSVAFLRGGGGARGL